MFFRVSERSPRGHERPLATAFLVALLLQSVVFGARTASAVDGNDAPPIGVGLDLSVPSLEARRKQLEASSEKPDDDTIDALRRYGEAINRLQVAMEWRRRADALGEIERNGPDTLRSVRDQIETLSRPAPTTVSTDASLLEVERLLAEAQARLDVERKSLLDLDATQGRLSERRVSLPAELAAVSATREGQLEEFDLPPRPGASVERTLARRAAGLAGREAAEAQVAALELEVSTFELRRDLLLAQRDLLRRKTDANAARVGELQAVLAQKRAKDAEKAAADARKDQASLASVDPALGRLAQENSRWTAERTGAQGLSAKMEAATRLLTHVEEKLSKLDERDKGVRQKVTAAGLTDAVGLLLRKELSDLPGSAYTRADIRTRREEIAAVQLKMLNLEDQLKMLPTVQSEVDGILAAQASTRSVGEQREIETAVAKVLKTHRSSLDALTRDYNAYFSTLVDLDATETKYVGVLDDYHDFLDRHVLWIPSANPPNLNEARSWRNAVRWLTSPANALAAGQRLVAGARSEAVVTALAGLLIVGLWFVYRRRLKRLLTELCDPENRTAFGLLPAPFAALLVVALLASPGPLALKLLEWVLRTAPLPPHDFTHALAVALGSLAFPLFAAEFLRRASAARGIAAAFLGWPGSALAFVRKQIVFIEVAALPAFALATLLDVQPQAEWGETLGRAVFCFGVGAAGLAMHRIVSPHGTVADQVLRHSDLEWMQPMLARAAWVPAAVALLVIAAAITGYYYTASVLVSRLCWSGLVLLLFLAASASAWKWLALREARSRQELEVQEEEDPSAGATAETLAALHADDLAAITRDTAQTRSALRVLFGLLLAVGLFSAWADVFPALRFFETVELWNVATTVEQTIGTGDAAHLESIAVQVPVTVANLLMALFGVVLAVFGARNLPGLLELLVLSRLGLDRGLRYAISTITRYIVFVVGAVVALQNLGVGWSNVQWLVAAVSVGLGFGLQEIFGNFVSGLILLFERPVRVGDMVTIEGTTGTVSRIEMRATTILDLDRKEVITPNKSLITGRLVNWSLQDTIVRLVVPVGVAYGSDTALVCRLLEESAKQSAGVLDTPRSAAFFMGFGASSLDFELRVFLVNADVLASARHDLLMAIDRKFRAAGVEIPFPQQDLHLRSVDAKAAAGLVDAQGATLVEKPS